MIVNHPAQALKALDRSGSRSWSKPNVGGSGAGIVRFDSREELEAAGGALDLGPDGTALVQDYLEPEPARSCGSR